jgi:hypothetical protein
MSTPGGLEVLRKVGVAWGEGKNGGQVNPVC